MKKEPLDNQPYFSDDDVVRSVREGRVQNFEVLVNRYKNKIVNFIHKMIFDYDEAQSLAQDTFLKVFEGINKYRAQDTFQAFVFTIAKNLTLNYIKKQRRFHWFSRTDNALEKEERNFQTTGTQQEYLERSQQEEWLHDALKSLKENQRIALILKVYLDFSYKKIAEITGWSEPKIETLICRAKNELRDYLRAREDVRQKPQGGKTETKEIKEKWQENEWPEVIEVRSI